MCIRDRSYTVNGVPQTSTPFTGPAGVYNVVATDANGCSASTTVTLVDPINVAPAITAGGPTTFCSGGSVELTSSIGSSYLWSNGATTPNIIVTNPGNYTVQVLSLIHI